MYKYIITCDSLEIPTLFAKTGKEAMNLFDRVTKAYNKEQGLVGESACLTCEEMGISSVEDLFYSTDLVWCNLISEEAVLALASFECDYEN